MLFLSFVLESPYVDTLPTTHQKPFIFDQLIPCNVGFDASATSDMRVTRFMPGDGVRGQNIEHLRFFLFLFFSCKILFVFEQQLLFRVDSLCDLGFSALGWGKHHASS